ncbi:hypothetical protein ACFRAO_24190 [Streptomyces sp. NPDC056656]|uniref:hypothetical protein n=1 Tax=Streptomyces sp. NPDC056656 TaxID=3345895 RepID=UPI00368D0672
MKTPGIGEMVKDTKRDRVGVVMGHEGSYVQLRPPKGGREWDANPEHITRVSEGELLSARVAEENAQSSRGRR